MFRAELARIYFGLYLWYILCNFGTILGKILQFELQFHTTSAKILQFIPTRHNFRAIIWIQDKKLLHITIIIAKTLAQLSRNNSDSRQKTIFMSIFFATLAQF